ncbi:hypothetical protein FSP39_001577 [Pinctada imbricata]|uniref:Uncharacterized protein n=1 Tax=Pinctada imbricata TaxID=66713 RepID=A0AA88XTW2_PINIB|nr:hypothetical protein FSP39_001577 [Pinctada imbricata]
MDVEEIDDADLYVNQLREVFDSCDSLERGSLGRSDLLQLCHKLQLDYQAEFLVERLLKEVGRNEVVFDEFKDKFVQILCQATMERVEVEGCQYEDSEGEDGEESPDGLEESERGQEIAEEDSSGREPGTETFTPRSEEEVEDLPGENEITWNVKNNEKEEEDKHSSSVNTEEDISHVSDLVTKEETESMEKTEHMDDEVTPKYVKGEKRYGRRSRPFDPKEFDAFVRSESPTWLEKNLSKHLKPPLPPLKSNKHSPRSLTPLELRKVFASKFHCEIWISEPINTLVTATFECHVEKLPGQI